MLAGRERSDHCAGLAAQGRGAPAFAAARRSNSLGELLEQPAIDEAEEVELIESRHLGSLVPPTTTPPLREADAQFGVKTGMYTVDKSANGSGSTSR